MANSLQSKIATTAFAFRGYNTTNLGRTPELLGHPTYGRTMRRYLQTRQRNLRRALLGGRSIWLTRCRGAKSREWIAMPKP